MGNWLEKIGLRKNQEEKKRQESMQEIENYLQESLEQYKMNQSRLRNMPETFIGLGHQEDTKDIAAVRNSLGSLKNIIIETAQKLGKDGNELIVDAENKDRIAQEQKLGN